ncbi:Bystin-domain-containing protein [Apiospora kogelbergensis]|uniref:Bystin-domain-containing protein n=1 Tax=Apiospora kogelbergensis TaxID=1337665 RepID=A0AAW0QKI3_9PEZI
MPKATTPNSRKARHDPLENEYLATGILKAPKERKSKSGKGKNTEREDGFVDAKASRKILQIGRELIEEDESAAPRPPPQEASAFGFDSRFEDEEGNNTFDDDENVWNDEDEDVEEEEIEVDDLATFNKFMPTENQDPLLQHGWPGQEQESAPEQSTNLADLIMAKIAAHESGGATLEPRDLGPPDEEFELPPKVVEVYSKIGMWLARYKSGQLPKPFKILPTIPNWEQIIELTKPDEWTPNACYAATRIFVSSTPIVVQRFAEIVLLEHVRSDIYETKKLNVHLFNALKKLLYKPASFFKGFLFPLVNSGCTLREATIISAVLSRVSIPVLHSAAALKGLCDIAAEQASSQGTEAAGSTNVFIKTLLEKKYALPYQVLDALVFHFLRFRSQDPASVKEGDVMMDISDERAAMQHKLPVIWHQCLLAFAQRYRNDITEDQREALLDLLLSHGHHSIGPEVRRELLAGRGRGVPLEQGPVVDGDDTMLVD